MYKVDDLPMENRQKTFLGILINILFFIAEALYVPCFVAIWRNMKESCYKIMFVLGVTDLCALWVCAFETGIFAILGSVFCSFPTFIYISGMIGNATYAMETSLTIILAVNRCLLFAAPKFEGFFFYGWHLHGESFHNKLGIIHDLTFQQNDFFASVSNFLSEHCHLFVLCVNELCFGAKMDLLFEHFHVDVLPWNSTDYLPNNESNYSS
uniref:7TM GPCR serpentine receptor class x (Srx) domain-containing protein n=1 Tax=Globodera rostochiensis TaxID=31243 RepID=A0A914IG38_GLORO